MVCLKTTANLSYAMKLISLITESSLVRLLAVGALFTFGLETRLPAPQSVDAFYIPNPGDFGAGATLELGPDGTGGLQINNWNIPTPVGTLTPGNSQITSGGDFPAQSFFDIFVDLTIPPPVIIEGTNGPPLGSYWNEEVAALPGSGSIGDASLGDTSVGHWIVPDHSPTWLLLLAGAGVLV